MTAVKRIYERVGESELYRLAGECRSGTFHWTSGPRELKTMQEWVALDTPQPPTRATDAGVAPPRQDVWQDLTAMATAYLARRAAKQAVSSSDVPAPLTDCLGRAVAWKKEYGIL
jgi:hypothetical protein